MTVRKVLIASAVMYVISGFMSVVQDSLAKNSRNYLKIKTLNGIVGFASRKVVGKLGKIAFNDIINITSVTTLKTDLMEFTTKMILILLAQSATKNAKNVQFHVLHVKS